MIPQGSARSSRPAAAAWPVLRKITIATGFFVGLIAISRVEWPRNPDDAGPADDAHAIAACVSGTLASARSMAHVAERGFSESESLREAKQICRRRQAVERSLREWTGPRHTT